MRQFAAEGAWLGRRCCQLTLTGSCAFCGATLKAKIRIRGQDGGRAEIENLSEIGNPTLSATNVPLSQRLSNLIKQILGLAV